MRSRTAKGIIQTLAGFIQAAGAVLYLTLVLGGVQQEAYFVAGIVVSVTVVSLAAFGWPGRRRKQ